MKKACIPRAIQLVIDDVGWREGWRLDSTGGPYRTGLNRLLGVEDYAAIAYLGEALGMRPSAAMVLCEWDRENACARQPTCTQQGLGWDNRHRIGSWCVQAADVFRSRSAHLELTLHGVGHEHWEHGIMTRAEWHDAKRSREWARKDLEGHLDIFRDILDQHGLGPKAGHRFPTSFVPCAFSYLWDEGRDFDTGSLMARAGVRYCSTPFGGSLDRRTPLLAPDGGVDHGVMVLDRGECGVPWDAPDCVPAQVMGRGTLTGSICGIHWTNLLSLDPSKNDRAIQHWTEYLKDVAKVPGQFLAANTRECFGQWAWHRFGKVTADEVGLAVDVSETPGPIRQMIGDFPLTLEFQGTSICELQLGRGDLRLLSVREDDGRVFARFRVPENGRGKLDFGVGTSSGEAVVIHSGTCQILDLVQGLDHLDLDLEVFGQQTLLLKIPQTVRNVQVECGRLTLSRWSMDGAAGTVNLTIAGQDIQGEQGVVRFMIA